MQARQAEEIANTPALSRLLVARALDGTASPRKAIKARCLQCSNYQRDEIANCTVYCCALWQFRPFQDKAEAEEDAG